MKITGKDEIEAFGKNVTIEFSTLDGKKFKKFSWEIFNEALDRRNFSAILVLLKDREILLERMPISKIKRMRRNSNSDEEFCSKVDKAILAKEKKLASLSQLIEQCKWLEENNK